MDHDDVIDLNIDVSRIIDHKEYGKLWKRMGKIKK